MQVNLRARGATAALAGALALAGCSTGTPTGNAGGASPAPVAASNPATAGPPTAAPPTEAAVMILEDAGLETKMPPGTYTSRLFEPSLTLELDGNWFRRDPDTERKVNIRHGQAGDEDLTFFSGIDFLQCGDGDVVEAPDISTAADLIAGMPAINATGPTELKIGGMPALELQLLGGGKGSTSDPIEDWLKNGCVVSFGDVAFPGDSGWLVELGSSEELLWFVDAGGQTVLIRARHGGVDVEGLWATMREVVGTVQFG